MRKIAILLIIFIVVSVGLLSGCNQQTKQTSKEGTAPIINSFTATPVVISLGKATVLNWSVENATNISINNGIGNVSLNGPYTVVPTQNQTYILTAFNSYGSSNASVKVYINGMLSSSLANTPSVSLTVDKSRTQHVAMINIGIITDPNVNWNQVNIVYICLTNSTQMPAGNIVNKPTGTISGGQVFKVTSCVNGTEYRVSMSYVDTGGLMGTVNWTQ